VDDPEPPQPWADELRPILVRHSIHRGKWHQFELIGELVRLGLFITEGETTLEAEPLEQQEAPFEPEITAPQAAFEEPESFPTAVNPQITDDVAPAPPGDLTDDQIDRVLRFMNGGDAAR